ncbi:cytochrome b/b6 domain-containing protein [Bdellovibrio sp. SKB1291214]|uniref:cytochrome b/b6 domain-containing protein n=1 Tax=Bdellovibrio sp. SKB1291214 TaxID=1732569 RepID=UPI000B516853|nr:cytochrome b/b6 domain-containing protein [Bdellovibrio sp. SKB1291214]UYL09281.1 cytochrome b/b6 domain-containing protein [Bdellovibrio sp. SKB1291214]
MTTNYSFKKHQPATMRWWHWLNALAILALLGTVLLRKTFLSWRTNAAYIQSKVEEGAGSITPEVAQNIAKGLRDVMWQWHYWIGFALGALLVARILIGIFVVKKCPATHAVQSAMGISKAPRETRITAVHYTLVKSGYALFYLITLYMVLSGIALYFKKEMGLSKDITSLLKEVHEFLMWFFVIFVAGHIAGVFIAENRGDKGLTSDMISGGE